MHYNHSLMSNYRYALMTASFLRGDLEKSRANFTIDILYCSVLSIPPVREGCSLPDIIKLMEVATSYLFNISFARSFMEKAGI